MDLKRFFGVLRRHKRLMIGGTVLAAVVAVLAYQLSPRSLAEPVAALDHASARSLRQRGAAAQPGQREVANNQPTSSVRRSQLPGVAGPDLCRIRERRGGSGGDSQISAHVQSGGHWHVRSSLRSRFAVGAADGRRSHCRGARKVARFAATTLENYVASEQAAGEVPKAQRVQFSFVQNGAQTKLLSGPSKITSLLLFVAILGCVIGLAFKLEKPGKSGDDEMWGGRSAIEADRLALRLKNAGKSGEGELWASRSAIEKLKNPGQSGGGELWGGRSATELTAHTRRRRTGSASLPPVRHERSAGAPTSDLSGTDRRRGRPPSDRYPKGRAGEIPAVGVIGLLIGIRAFRSLPTGAG